MYAPCTRPKTAVARAAYTGRVHGSYTARSRPCTRPSTLMFVYMGRRYGIYTAVYVPCTRPITASRRAVYAAVYTCMRVHLPCIPLHGSVRAVYTAECMARTEPCTRAVCTAVHGRVHVRVHGHTAVYTFVYTARKQPVHGHVTAVYTHVRVHVQVYTCTWRVHGHVRAMYTAEYGRCTAAYTGRVHGSYTARSRPCRLHLYT